MNIEDLLRGFLKRAAPAAVAYQQGSMEGAEMKRARELEEAARAQEAADRLRGQKREDMQDKLAREEAERERLRYEYETANPHVHDGKRFATEEAMKEYIRWLEHMRGEERDEHRAPPRPTSSRSSGGSDTPPRGEVTAAATGDARRWFSRTGSGRNGSPVEQTVAGAVRALKARHNLSDGEAWKIATDAQAWAARQRAAGIEVQPQTSSGRPARSPIPSTLNGPGEF